MFGRVIITNLKPLDSHVTFIVNGKYAASPLGNQMLGV